jgi:hypothetical protein
MMAKATSGTRAIILPKRSGGWDMIARAALRMHAYRTAISSPALRRTRIEVTVRFDYTESGANSYFAPRQYRGPGRILK